MDFLPLTASVCGGDASTVITQGEAVAVCITNPFYPTYRIATLSSFGFSVGSIYTQSAVEEGVVQAFTSVFTCSITTTTEGSEQELCTFESFLTEEFFAQARASLGTGQTISTVTATGKAIMVKNENTNAGGRHLATLEGEIDFDFQAAVNEAITTTSQSIRVSIDFISWTAALLLCILSS